MSGVMNRHFVWINYNTALTGNFSAGVRIVKQCTQGLARTRIALCNAGADGRNGRNWRGERFV